MTLADLANYVCTLVNQSETADVAACKSFFQRRFVMIWQDELWKDSLFEYTQTLVTPGYTPASTWLPTKKVLLLPPQIELPIGVRTDTRKLNVETSETFYRIDFDTWSSSGSVTQFRLLPRCVWEFDAPQAFNVIRSAAADNGAVLTIRGLDADGVTLDSLTPALNGGLNPQTALHRIDSVGKLATQGSVQLLVDGTESAATVSGAGQASVNGVFARAGTDNGLPLYGDPGFVGVTLFSNAPGWRISATVNSVRYSVYDSADDVPYPSMVTTWTLDPTALAAGVARNPLPTVAVTLKPFAMLQATDTAVAKRQRIQLFGTIPEGSIVRVLGKTIPPAFTADSDEPALTGVENALIAFAHADMLKRERQYGKAAAMAQEGATLLEQLKRTQVVQQARNARFLPEDGYAWDYATPITSPLAF